MAGRTQLNFALDEESVEDLIESLEEDANVNVTNKNSQTDLICAVRNNSDLEVINALLAAGADVNVTDENGQTALLHAVRNNSDLEVIKALLDTGADHHCKGYYGNTLLHYVSSADIARELLSRGLSVNAVNIDMETPLYIAVKKGKSCELIESLLESGADVNVTDKFGKTALLLYATRNNSDLDVIKALLAAGADHHCKGYYGNTLLHYVNSVDIAKVLLSHGLSINAVNIDMETPLYIAVKEGKSREFIESLLEEDADVNVTEKYGHTALIRAVTNNSDLEVVKLLLNAGADVNKTDENGLTALHHAVRNNSDLEVINALLAAGADLKVTDENGRTVLHYAARNNSALEASEALLTAGARMNVSNENGQTAIHCSVKNNSDLEVFKTLLAAGADVQCKDHIGNTLLHHVRRADIARELLTCGLNVNTKNIVGETPLHCVAKQYPPLYEHELYSCNGVISSAYGCRPCAYKELVWTLVLKGVDVNCDIHSLLDMVVMEEMTWAKFFIKVLLIRNSFDALEGTVGIISYKSYFNSLKTLGRRNILDNIASFLDNCDSEIDSMKTDMVSGNISLYNFFYKCGKSENIIPLYTSDDKVEENIVMKYPIYRELMLPKIRPSIERSVLLNKLKNSAVYIKKSKIKEISLGYYILRFVAEYLSNDDLANLVRCVMDE